MCSCSVESNSLWPRGLEPARLLCPWDSGQEYWSGFPFPPPGDLPNPDIKPKSPAAPALAGGLFITVLPGKPQVPDSYPLLRAYEWEILSHWLSNLAPQSTLTNWRLEVLFLKWCLGSSQEQMNQNLLKWRFSWPLAWYCTAYLKLQCVCRLSKDLTTMSILIKWVWMCLRFCIS